MRFLLAALCLVAGSGGLAAQEAVRLVESFTPGYQYHVSCRVDIAGSLTLPADKGGKSLTLTGNSAIDYDERILPPLKGERSLRQYRRMDFQRKVGEQAQNLSLRAEVRRLVILRHQQFEVPFSPDGPLSWNEIDLVRTDVYTPALAGLLPASHVRVGEAWQASEGAVRELTDLEKLQTGELRCTFETVTTLVGRRLARVKLEGSIQGVGEDGQARHQLEGYYLFDLESNHLSYLYVKGSQAMLDNEGKERGKIDGSFILTREPRPFVKELDDAAVAGLEPNEENTLLLFDDPDVGVRFLYPRRWRVAGVNGRQIGLDEQRGSGLLITVEPLSRTPAGGQYLQEARTWLNGQKATLYKQDVPKMLAGSTNVENFTLDAQVDRQRVWLDYYVVRHTLGGATLVARLTAPDQPTLQRDVARIAKSVQITRKQ